MSIETAHILIAVLGAAAALIGLVSALLALANRKTTARIEVKLNGRIDEIVAAIEHQTPKRKDVSL